MAKTTSKASPIPARDSAAELSTAQQELTELETNLALRRAGAATSTDSPLTIALDLEQRAARIAAKKMEIDIILQRIDIEAKARADAEHQAKVAELGAILPERLELLAGMDECLTRFIELGGKLDRLDSCDVAPRLGGINTSFAIRNRSWVALVFRLLAKGSIGLDTAMDSSLPALKLADHARALHKLMLEELADSPRALKELRARSPLPKLIHPDGYKPNSMPDVNATLAERVSHGGNATNYDANGKLLSIEEQPLAKPVMTKPLTRLYTDKLEQPYE